MTEYEKMKKGKYFNPTDKELLFRQARTYWLVQRFNHTSMLNQSRRNRLLKKIFGDIETPTYYVQSPIYVDYGFNTHIGKNFLSNYNLVLMDEGEIHIGDNVMIAPNVTLTTTIHPFLADERRVCQVPNRFPHGYKGNYECAKPIIIEDDVWICANVTICPGVTIGHGSIIGAGSVVTRNIPPEALAFGIPCEAIRPITEDDRIERIAEEDTHHA